MSSNQIPPSHQKILEHFGISNPVKLGQGVPSIVYDFSPGKIIKIYINQDYSVNQIEELQDFYNKIDWNDNKIAVPEIQKVGRYQDRTYSIEKKLAGENAYQVFLSSNKKIRSKLLNNYFQLLPKISSIKVDGQYGDLLKDYTPQVRSDSWRTVIRKKLSQKLDETLTKPNHDIKEIEKLFNKYFEEVLPNINPGPEKKLVHGDLFLENVLANPEGDITALLDFGPLTMTGDHLMDVAGLVYFSTVCEGVSEETVEHLKNLAKNEYPNSMSEIDNYLLYYSLFFINSMKSDPRTYNWCLKNLRVYGYLN